MQIYRGYSIDIIRQSELENFLLLQESRASLKRRLEEVDASFKAKESQLIEQIEAGAQIQSHLNLSIRSIERRYPHWKEHFVEIAGAKAAESILAITPATITKYLIIKE